jgi:hypothetical protein
LGEIFLSYARADKEWVDRLAGVLTTQGLSLWFDEDLVPGDYFDAEIEAALQKASKVLVVWSNHSVGSRWVKAEAGEGLDRGILVPILKEAIRIPLEFRRVQAANLSDWTGDEKHREFRKLLASLRSRKTLADGRASSMGRRDRVPNNVVVKDRRVTAELISVNRYWSNARIRLIINRQMLIVEHVNKVLYQVVRVGGVEVARGGSLWDAHDYFQFFIEHDGEQLFAELRPSVSLWTGLKRLRLYVEEEEVLSEPISWARGAWLLFALLVPFLLAVLVSSLVRL